MVPAARHRQFRGLDGLRGIAALVVVLFHYGVYFHTAYPKSGYLAVDLFFALSGFVLAFAYEDRLRAGLSFRHFMLLRLIRLYPLYAAGLLLGCLAAVLAHGSPENLYQGAGSLRLALMSGVLIMPTWPGRLAGEHYLFPLNWPAWSLFFELVANAAYALMAPYLGNRLLIGLVGVAAIALTGEAYVHSSLNAGVFLGNWDVGLCRVSFSFFMGIGLYRLWEARLTSWVRLPFWCTSAVMLAVLAFAPVRMIGLYDIFAVVIIFPLLILAATRDPAPRWAPLLGQLGAVSYAVYVVHFPIIVVVRSFCLDGGLATPFWPLGAISLAGTCVLAALLHCYFDVPTRRWLTRLTGWATQPPSPASLYNHGQGLRWQVQADRAFGNLADRRRV